MVKNETKPLKTPVMDNLDDLTDSELKHYFNVWFEESQKAKTQYDEAKAKLLQISEEASRREIE